MDVDLAIASVAAITGGAVGLAAGLAFRWSEGSRRTDSARPEPQVPRGVERVLAVLKSNSLVLDDRREVLQASPAAYAFGIVRHGRLAVPELDKLAEQVQRDGEIRELAFEMQRDAHQDTHPGSEPDAQHAPHREAVGQQSRFLTARVAPLTNQSVLILIEDLTQSHRVDEIRRDFVANVSHELKTPIGALSLLAEAVLDASDDPAAVRRFATRMQGETERLARLIQEIIDLSRLQYDDPIDSPELVSVDAVVAAAVDRSRVDADAKQIRLTSRGEPGLRVLGNPTQLVMALGNLVENAVAYSPDRSRVSVDARAYGANVEISVTDQGMGINESELKRIFERFYRGDPARSRATGGTGLGLSIVKHVAASHGGVVDVRSVRGQGSTFTLRLPLPPADQARHAVRAARTAGSTAGATG